MAPAGCFGTRAALTPAPRMAAYDDGSSASAGSGEIEMEMQELIVDFTDDGRILLEVKGVKVGSDKSTYSEKAFENSRRPCAASSKQCSVCISSNHDHKSSYPDHRSHLSLLR